MTALNWLIKTLLITAKCIINQLFLISISPSGLLIWQVGKILTNQHFLGVLLPNQHSTLTYQQISILPKTLH